MAAMDAIHFKFTSRAGPRQRQAVFEAIAAENARYRPQFPDEKDKQLAAIHVVEGNAGALKKLLATLSDMAGVEYAEKRAKRRLVS